MNYETLARPVLASALRAVQKMSDLGDPLLSAVSDQLRDWDMSSPEQLQHKLTALLAPFVLVESTIDEHGVCTTQAGAAARTLEQHGWRSFIVKISNPHRFEGSLVALTQGSWGAQGVLGIIDDASRAARVVLDDALNVDPLIERAWLGAQLAEPAVSSLEIEYKVVSLYSRDDGVCTGSLGFALTLPPEAHTIPGSGKAGGLRLTSESRARSAVLEFDCKGAREVHLDVREADGRSCMAAIRVRDSLSRFYPSRAMRVAPDMFFQEHVYRATGETIQLPSGHFQVTAQRGSEYRPVTSMVEVTASTTEISIVLDRWVDPASHGYYSGDPHIHAGGCSHYSVPSEGVTPETMIRHVRGEGLWLASVLNWAPSYYHQKQYFSGASISPSASLELPNMQRANGVTWSPRHADLDDQSYLRYDIEVSGFPSSHSGHAILLGLTDQDYPGATLIEEWPSWNLPIMRWAKSQRALVGYAHAGFGLGVDTEELPNYEVPSFQSVGSNEIIVDVPLEAADFQCGSQFSPAAELNIWYHLLNVGYRTLMMGETDYPCIYDDRPGVGRTYVQLTKPPHGERALEAWLQGLQTGASYFGDGRSHIFDLALEGRIDREFSFEGPADVTVTATVAALLDEMPRAAPVGRPLHSGPVGWDLERSRIGSTRTVHVELIVNGTSVAHQIITADGTEQTLNFVVHLEQSSWVALRILRSVHTQPVFVEIGGRPIRASRRSAQWLHDSVDALWAAKSGFIREIERDAARDAYQKAKKIYRRRGEECTVNS